MIELWLCVMVKQASKKNLPYLCPRSSSLEALLVEFLVYGMVGCFMALGYSALCSMLLSWSPLFLSWEQPTNFEP